MLDVRDRDVVAVLTRAPSAGGKARLFAGLSRPADTDLLSAFLLDTLDALALPGVIRAACFTPAAAEPELRRLVPYDVQLFPQRGDDLGDRMRCAFDDLFASGARSAVLVGSDLPGIQAAAVTDALTVLNESHGALAIGPAIDGGYYLLGATRTPSVVLTAMQWGHPDVLAETERRARAAGIEIRRVTSARDIDTVDDLRALLESAAPAVRTREACRELHDRLR
jgi:uncharacterized protein